MQMKEFTNRYCTVLNNLRMLEQFLLFGHDQTYNIPAELSQFSPSVYNSLIESAAKSKVVSISQHIKPAAPYGQQKIYSFEIVCDIQVMVLIT